MRRRDGFSFLPLLRSKLFVAHVFSEQITLGKYYNRMIKSLIFTLFGIQVILSAQVAAFDESVSQRIFKAHESILVYVRGGATDQSSEQIFKEYCEKGFSCSLLTPEDAEYRYITSFVGYQYPPFVFLIDSQQQKKYVLSATYNFSHQAVENFMLDFDKNELQPYYASEPQVTLQPFDHIFKLVGVNYEDFLGRDEPIKIVYLYSSDPVCEVCTKMLTDFHHMAIKHREEGLLVFGYFDVTKNDNQYIRDEIFPYFLIYVIDNFEDPYGLSAEQFKQLDSYIKQMKKQFLQMNQTQSVRQNQDDDFEQQL